MSEPVEIAYIPEKCPECGRSFDQGPRPNMVRIGALLVLDDPATIARQMNIVLRDFQRLSACNIDVRHLKGKIRVSGWVDEALHSRWVRLKENQK